jgi:hypothetical protein
MLYGCGCVIVKNPNCLMTLAEIRFFYIFLSTIKCNGVPFIHICEWNRCYHSLGSTGSFGLIFVVEKVGVGYASVIIFFSIFSRPYSELGFGFMSLTSTTNEYFERHSLVLSQGFLWKSHYFPVSLFFFPLPLLSYFLD